MPADWTRKEALIIVNPMSHNAPGEKRLREAAEWMAHRGWKVELIETQAAGDATRLASSAAEAGLPLVFVCGGDGTLNEAANGLAGSESTLAVMPAGTVNLWAREMGLMRKPLTAARLAIEGDRRCIDLGKTGSRYFMLVAGFGVDGAVIRHASERLKRRLGATAYLIASLRELMRYRPTRLRVRLDGDSHDLQALVLVAGNTRRYAGITQVTSRALADDGKLDVCIYQGSGRPTLFFSAARTLLGRHVKAKNVLYRRVKNVEMEWEHPVHVQLDGETYDRCPPTIEAVPHALWVAVKSGTTSPLFSRAGGPPETPAA